MADQDAGRRAAKDGDSYLIAPGRVEGRGRHGKPLIADYMLEYWTTLKSRLKFEGSQVVTNCDQLKMPAADGKNYLTDAATAETGKMD